MAFIHIVKAARFKRAIIKTITLRSIYRLDNLYSGLLKLND